MFARFTHIERIFEFATGFLDRRTRRKRAVVAGASTLSVIALWFRAVLQADTARAHRTASRARHAAEVERRLSMRAAAIRRRTGE